MKFANKFCSVSRNCLLILLLGIVGTINIQAQTMQDMWVLPEANTWRGRGLIGSPTDPSLVPIQFQGEILFVPPTEVAGYLQRGGKTGWPEVVVPLLLHGKPVAVPIWQVQDYLKKGAQPDKDLVIMNNGTEHIAVFKKQVDEYKAKGYALGPREQWTEGFAMCFKNQLVVVSKEAIAKYTKLGAEDGPCKKPTKSKSPPKTVPAKKK